MVATLLHCQNEIKIKLNAPKLKKKRKEIQPSRIQHNEVYKKKRNRERRIDICWHFQF